MPDESTDPGGEGPPSYPGSTPPPSPGPPPGGAPGPAPGMPPPVPAPAVPSYPAPPPPPPPGSYPVGGYVSPQPQYASYDGAGGTGNAPYAQWGTRVGGYLIDVVIFIPVLVVLGFLFKHSGVLVLHLNTRRNGVETRRTFSLLSVLVFGLLNLVYVTVLCGGARGQTVGMMAVGIRVVRDETFAQVGYGASVRAGGRASGCLALSARSSSSWFSSGSSTCCSPCGTRSDRRCTTRSPKRWCCGYAMWREAG